MAENSADLAAGAMKKSCTAMGRGREKEQDRQTDRQNKGHFLLNPFHCQPSLASIQVLFI